MDNCIRQGVDPSNDPVLPGSLRLKRRAPGLYSRLMRGFYPNLSAPSSPSISMNTPSLGTSSSGGDLRVPSASTSGTPALGASSNTPSRAPRVRGSFDHPIMPVPPRRTVFPAMDFLSTYAIAVNEVNAAGGRVVTSPSKCGEGPMKGGRTLITSSSFRVFTTQQMEPRALVRTYLPPPPSFARHFPLRS